MFILGIETSCDETAAALLNAHQNKWRIISNAVASQIKIHRKYGGIVPEVAARKHVENIIPVLREALQPLGKNPAQKIDAIAVTNGPGLITSLTVGVETAQLLSLIWQKPLIAINHLEGHIYSCLLDKSCTEIFFPALALIVSGGHTELVLIKKHLDYQVIGATLDDAAGECFDKVAKLLKIGYPGGPIIAKIAKKGNPSIIPLPRPLIERKDFNFSFSGLKTAVLYSWRDQPQKELKYLIPLYCAAVQQAIIDVLITKTLNASQQYQAKTILLCGGVAANEELRKQMAEKIKRGGRHTLLVPPPQFCTDNAAMVALAAYFRILHKKFTPSPKTKVAANLELMVP